MSIPDFLGDQVDEPGAFENCALTARLASEEAINRADAQALDTYSLGGIQRDISHHCPDRDRARQR